MEKRIVISPIGPQDNEILLLIGREIKNFFGYETEIIPVLENIDFAIDFKRNQYHSTAVLEKLAEKESFDQCESEDVEDCIECGSCSYTCPSARPLLDYIRHGKVNVMRIKRERSQK